jgi:hypothetical protein
LLHIARLDTLLQKELVILQQALLTKRKLLNMNKNRLLNALFKTMLFFAICHLTLLFVLFIMSFKLSYLNAFSIIGLNNFFPGIDEGIVSFLISALISLIIYLIFFVNSDSRKK